MMDREMREYDRFHQYKNILLFSFERMGCFTRKSEYLYAILSEWELFELCKEYYLSVRVSTRKGD